MFLSFVKLLILCIYYILILNSFFYLFKLNMKKIDLSSKKVVIWGLGLNQGGLGMAKFFLKNNAKVKVIDKKNKKDLQSSIKELKDFAQKINKLNNLEFILGHQDIKDFADADIVVKNPAIKPDDPLLLKLIFMKKTIVMEMALFHKLFDGDIIGITGTRGKTTTTYLIYNFLKQKFKHKVFLGGNVGKSAINELENLDKHIKAVLEISSFQLVAMGYEKVSPHVAVLTNIYKDHLNWHKDFDDYINTKFNILKYQTQDDFAVLNIDNKILKTFLGKTKAKVFTVSKENKKADFYTYKNKVFFKTKPLFSLDKVLLEGDHNIMNILEATAVAVGVYDIDVSLILKVLSSFKGVPYRQEYIKTVKGVDFINDTTATTIEAMQVALARFSKNKNKKIIFISGGVDKGLDFEKLDLSPLKALVLLEGSASLKLKQVASKFDIPVFGFFSNMKDAVFKAFSIADENDLVVLCPGGSSFNLFKNEFDRGDRFNKAVVELSKNFS